MRAKDFIVEYHLPLDFTHPSMQNARYLPNIDKYYELYRLGLDMAQVGADGKIEGSAESDPHGEAALLLGYSDADEHIINTALKHRGHKQVKSSKGKSKELDDTHAVSPVAKFKPTKKSSR